MLLISIENSSAEDMRVNYWPLTDFGSSVQYHTCIYVQFTIKLGAIHVTLLQMIFVILMIIRNTMEEVEE